MPQLSTSTKVLMAESHTGRLHERVALITGGGGDIGSAIAATFVENGGQVVLSDADSSLLEAVKDRHDPDRVKCLAGDVRSFDDMTQAVSLCVRSFGKLDILVTCAGVLKHQPIDQMSVADWERVVGINLSGTFMACKAAVPEMKRRQYGRIVTISSVGGRTGRPHVGADYAAAKAGVIGMTRSLARELGAFGITANSIAPGPLAGRMTSQMPPENLKVLISTACVPRLGRPSDIAYAALYLASDEAEWVTGEVFDVNGGVYI